MVLVSGPDRGGNLRNRGEPGFFQTGPDSVDDPGAQVPWLVQGSRQ